MSKQKLSKSKPEINPGSKLRVLAVTPPSYNNRGGLWGSCQNINTLLVKTQKLFNEWMSTSESPVTHIPTEDIIQKIDIGWVVSKEPSIRASIKTSIIKKL